MNNIELLDAIVKELQHKFTEICKDKSNDPDSETYYLGKELGISDAIDIIDNYRKEIYYGSREVQNDN